MHLLDGQRTSTDPDLTTIQCRYHEQQKNPDKLIMNMIGI